MSRHWVLGLAVAWLASSSAWADPPGKTAADRVTLTTGKIVQGEVIEPSPRGMLWMYVCRDWAKANLPAEFGRWEAEERPSLRKATAQRRERLSAWKRERGVTGPDDRVGTLIDRELARLGDVGATDAPLILAKLTRGQIKGIETAGKPNIRLLRLAWTSHLKDPEAMSPDQLEDALEGRGFDPAARTAVPIEPLLPLPVEPENAWQVRRAATEVVNEPGLRFLKTNGIIIPEPEGGQGINALDLGSAVGALKSLLDPEPGDPLQPQLRRVAERGRSGAIVTSLDIAPDLASVSVEMRLWVRTGAGQWTPAGSRSARVRTDDLPNDAGANLAADPQVSGAFQVVEALGLGKVTPEIKKRSLSVGAATQKALAEARTAASEDLQALALRAEGDKPGGP